MKLKTIAFIIVALFSFIGLLVFSTFAHELSHRQDLKGAVVEDELCFMKMPFDGTMGYYSWSETKNQTELKRVEKYTEYKAYAISSIINFIYTFSMLYLILNWRKA